MSANLPRLVRLDPELARQLFVAIAREIGGITVEEYEVSIYKTHPQVRRVLNLTSLLLQNDRSALELIIPSLLWLFIVLLNIICAEHPTSPHVLALDAPTKNRLESAVSQLHQIKERETTRLLEDIDYDFPVMWIASQADYPNAEMVKTVWENMVWWCSDWSKGEERDEERKSCATKKDGEMMACSRVSFRLSPRPP